MAGIKTIQQQNAEKKLQNIWQNWMNLKKHKNRQTKTNQSVEKFTDLIDNLWDIGASDAIATIQSNRFLSEAKKQDDISFYEEQKGLRIATMSGRDKVLHGQIKRKLVRSVTCQSRTSQDDSDQTDQDHFVFCSSDSMSSTSFEHSDFDCSVISEKNSKQDETLVTLLAPRNILQSKDISTAADRLKISDNSLTMLIASFIKACKGDTNDFNLSRSTVRRARSGSRLEISQAIMRDMFHTPSKNIALHWDGKLIQDRLGNKHEALAILVSAAPDHSEGKLLGVQKLANASSKQQARASFEMLQKWQLVEEVVALVFDTTSSNSGWRNGAARMLECFLEKKVFLSCLLSPRL